MKIRLAVDSLQSDSIVDGEGIRSVIWTQGCTHNCLGCHNPETHSFQGGIEIDVEVLKEKIRQLQGQDGVTFSGGDPMAQPEACFELAKYCKELGLNVWCYTGYKFEELLQRIEYIPAIKDFLNNIDVLVDGKFILSEKSYDVAFRGSKNQRIIDVKQSLKTGKIIELEKYKNIFHTDCNKKREHLYV